MIDDPASGLGFLLLEVEELGATYMQLEVVMVWVEDGSGGGRQWVYGV